MTNVSLPLLDEGRLSAALKLLWGGEGWRDEVFCIGVTSKDLGEGRKIKKERANSSKQAFCGKSGCCKVRN